MNATAKAGAVKLRQIQFSDRPVSRMTPFMSTRFGMRSLAILGIALVATQLSYAQETPSRISWAPSYSGSCTDCSLVGQNMSGWDISNVNYPGADLTAANLQRVQGHDANFRGAQAAGADLRLGDFTGASFEDATLVRARIGHALFNSAKMNGVILTGATMNEGKFIGAILIDAQIQSGIAHNADFSAATLSGARLTAADLTGSIFDNAVLLDTNLAEANLTNVSFRDARLSGANLEGAIGIETANFEGACGSAGTRLPDGLTLPECVAY